MKQGLCPDFPFFVNDWLSSTAVNAMTLAEQGAYLRLLCLAWNEPDCTLPDDDAQLSLLSLLNRAWALGSDEKIRACFCPDPDRPGHRRRSARTCGNELATARQRPACGAAPDKGNSGAVGEGADARRA